MQKYTLAQKSLVMVATSVVIVATSLVNGDGGDPKSNAGGVIKDNCCTEMFRDN